MHGEGLGLVGSLEQESDFGTSDGRLLYDGAGCLTEVAGHKRRLSQLFFLVGNVAEEDFGIAEGALLLALSLQIVVHSLFDFFKALGKESSACIG